MKTWQKYNMVSSINENFGFVSIFNFIIYKHKMQSKIKQLNILGVPTQSTPNYNKK